MDVDLREAIGSALGTTVVGAAGVRGGDVASSWRVQLEDGRIVFAKTHPSAPPGFFTTEAAGLRWLDEARAIPVPNVLAVSDVAPNHLVLEWIDEGREQVGTETETGQGLVMLHRAGAPSYGRADRRPTGSRALPNEPCATWPEFYATQRLLPLARLAADAGALDAVSIGGLERVAAILDQLPGSDEPPARLHGDLWAGNRLVDRDGRSWLIDPAAHGGHREFDLAMMRLFGGFKADAFAAYMEDWPLAPDWQERVALHQIAPLVVHAIKFGGGYAGAASRAIAQYAR